jgi:hypothetical protein
MFRKSLGICIGLAFAVSLAMAAGVSESGVKPSASEIVDKNVAARGGLKAWRAVQTISLQGKLGAGGNQPAASTLVVPKRGTRHVQETVPTRPTEEAQLPFVMEMKRSHKSRIELQFKGQTAIQVFDGTHGWKLRPFLNRHEVEPYTADETEAASAQAELDGPLVDYEAKGSKVELVGSEKVGDRDTYKLAVTTHDGHVQHIWVDAQNYLEVKVEGIPRRLDGKLHPVEVYYDEYRSAPGGLVVPYVYDTRVEGVKQTEKIQVESVLVNPKLDDTLFTKLN